MPIDRSAEALLRRRLLGGALLLPLTMSGCAAATWPKVPAGAGSSSARDRLRESAAAHGLAAMAALHDVNLGFSGLWSPINGLVAQTGTPAQARWLPAESGMVALAPTATSGLAAQALLADLHRLLWLGAMAVADTPGAVNWAEPETLNDLRCDHLHLALVPGLGGAAVDRLSLFIDRSEGWLRRLRVSLSALGSVGDTVAEIDLARHRRLYGVLWPSRFQANRPRPAFAGAPVIWQLSGLDVNRGYRRDDIAGAVWTGSAAAPAQALPPD